MINNGGRNGTGFPSGKPCPKAHVRVLAIREKILVKKPYVVEHLFPVKSGARARNEYLSGRVVLARVNFVSAPSLREAVSLFRVSMYFPFAMLMPLLFPAANPVFPLFSITTTSGKFSFTKSAEPSVEPLSTNITSRRRRFWARTDSRQSFKNLLPLKLTMIK